MRADYFARAQSSVEFALVMIAFMSIALGLWALQSYISDGDFDTRIIEHASHAIESAAPGAWGDVIVY